MCEGFVKAVLTEGHMDIFDRFICFNHNVNYRQPYL